MIVDGKGKLFEDRRKKVNDRRVTEIDKTDGRRKEERRKALPQVPETKGKRK